jgi:hypothetical protein
MIKTFSKILEILEMLTGIIYDMLSMFPSAQTPCLAKGLTTPSKGLTTPSTLPKMTNLNYLFSNQLSLGRKLDL